MEANMKKIKLPLIPSLLLVFLGVGFASISPFSVAADDYAVPLTEWGQPDLQGVWNFSSNTPLERPIRFGDRQFLTADEIASAVARREAADAASDAALPIAGVDGSYNDFWIENAGIGEEVRTSHIIYPLNGRIPDLAEGARVQRSNYGSETVQGESRPVRFAGGGIGTDGPEDRGLSERCLVGFNAGPPFIPSLYNNNVQIFQSRDHAVIMTEMIHDARIVSIRDRSETRLPLHEEIRMWSGDANGYWEGDTLVVVTRNFNDLTASFGSSGTSRDKVLTERFTRVGPYTVNYQFTVDDPSTFSDKFTAIVPMTKVAGQLYEYACHEGNYGMVNTLRGARVQESMAEN